MATENHIIDPPVIDGPVGPVVNRDQVSMVNLSGINFLDLQSRPDVREHFGESARVYGMTTGGSRLSQGICRPHYQLEQDFSLLLGKERAISFASGLLANLGFVHAMSRRMRLSPEVDIDNRDSVFVLDRDAHWSLWKAVEGMAYGRRVFSFRHNDAQDLDRVLGRVDAGKVVVLFESVYSADGSVAPLDRLLDICEKYDAVSYVDDANGFLLYGPAHRPFAGQFAALERATFVMASFSKAVGLEGGAIAGPAEAIVAFELLSGTSMFTAAMQPPTASTARYVLRLLADQPSIVDRYLDRVASFQQQLRELGCRLAPTGSYITSVHVGQDDTAYQLRQAFRERGFVVPVFHYPAVPWNQSVLRVMLNANHTDQQLNRFLVTLGELRRRFGF